MNTPPRSRATGQRGLIAASLTLARKIGTTQKGKHGCHLVMPQRVLLMSHRDQR